MFASIFFRLKKIICTISLNASAFSLTAILFYLILVSIAALENMTRAFKPQNNRLLVQRSSAIRVEIFLQYLQETSLPLDGSPILLHDAKDGFICQLPSKQNHFFDRDILFHM